MGSLPRLEIEGQPIDPSRRVPVAEVLPPPRMPVGLSKFQRKYYKSMSSSLITAGTLNILTLPIFINLLRAMEKLDQSWFMLEAAEPEDARGLTSLVSALSALVRSGMSDFCITGTRSTGFFKKAEESKPKKKEDFENLLD